MSDDIQAESPQPARIRSLASIEFVLLELSNRGQHRWKGSLWRILLIMLLFGVFLALSFRVNNTGQVIYFGGIWCGSKTCFLVFSVISLFLCLGITNFAVPLVSKATRRVSSCLLVLLMLFLVSIRDHEQEIARSALEKEFNRYSGNRPSRYIKADTINDCERVRDGYFFHVTTTLTDLDETCTYILGSRNYDVYYLVEGGKVIGLRRSLGMDERDLVNRCHPLEPYLAWILFVVVWALIFRYLQFYRQEEMSGGSGSQVPAPPGGIESQHE